MKSEDSAHTETNPFNQGIEAAITTLGFSSRAFIYPRDYTEIAEWIRRAKVVNPLPTEGQTNSDKLKMFKEEDKQRIEKEAAQYSLKTVKIEGLTDQWREGLMVYASTDFKAGAEYERTIANTQLAEKDAKIKFWVESWNKLETDSKKEIEDLKESYKTVVTRNQLIAKEKEIEALKQALMISRGYVGNYEPQTQRAADNQHELMIKIENLLK